MACKRTLPFFLWLAWAVSAGAAESSPETALRQIVAERTRAWITGDQAAYAQLTADNIQVIDATGKARKVPGRLPSDQPLSSGGYQIDVKEVCFRGEAAVVHYRLTQFLSCEDGAPYEVTRRTDTFRQIDGQWKLVEFRAAPANTRGE